MLTLYLMDDTQKNDLAHGLVVCVVVRSLNKRVELALEWTISCKMVTLENEALKLLSHGSILGLEGIHIGSLLEETPFQHFCHSWQGKIHLLGIRSRFLEGTSIVCH